MSADGDTTWQKALEINLDARIYGVLAEIGAGQEVARWFFRVGGAAGTVAKTISAYDMTVSDQIYGKAGRYVSRERLLAMLDREYRLLLERLAASRGQQTCFFAFADTVAARNYRGSNQCRGWMGLRFQHEPGAPPSDVHLHLVPLDPTNAAQQEAIGTLGVNLIHAAFHRGRGAPAEVFRKLLDGLSLERIEIDTVHLSGPAFGANDSVRSGLALLHAEVTRCVMVEPPGRLVPPVDVMRKRAVVLERGRFTSASPVYARLLAKGLAKLKDELPGLERPPVAMFELSVESLRESLTIEEAMPRVCALLPLGYPVLVSRFRESFRLTSYLRRLSREGLRFVAGVSSLVEVLDEACYADLPGGLLEGMGRLLADNVRVYVHPMQVEEFRNHLANYGVDLSRVTIPVAGVVTAESLAVHGALGQLYGYLLTRGLIVPIAEEKAP